MPNAQKELLIMASSGVYMGNNSNQSSFSNFGLMQNNNGSN